MASPVVGSGRMTSSRLGTPTSPAPRLTASARSMDSTSLVVRNGSARALSTGISKNGSCLSSAKSNINNAITTGPPKVPMLRLGNASNNVASVLSVPERKSSTPTVGTCYRPPSGKLVAKQPVCTIFQPAPRPTTPKVSAFHAAHTHSDPFSGGRQQPLPSTSKRTSIPPPEPQNHSPPKIRTSMPQSQSRTDPINQRGPLTPTATQNGKDLSQQRLGRRCQSAPAARGLSEPRPVRSSIRCNNQQPREEVVVKPTIRCPSKSATLQGVWTPVQRPVKTVVTKAPFAQNTPRAVTPPATVRRATTPYATNTPRVITPQPVAEVRKPFHTNTPRAPSPSTSRHVVQAPFHTSTPRNNVMKSTHAVKPILH